MEPRDTEALMDRFKAVWARRDARAVAACFCPDGRYLSSIGPLPGNIATGRRDIETLVEAMFRTDAGSTPAITNMAIHPSGAAWTWRYTFADGHVALGCDLFRFRDGLIETKDAYRKVKAQTDK